MESNPLVTIGILSYNRPDDLRQAILSVINQTYSNLEILVSDNGSHIEEVKNVIREFAERDHRIKFFFHEVNQGPLFNFHFLVNKASGKYFAWLADDDYFTNNFVEDTVSCFATIPGIVLASNMPISANTKQPIEVKYIPDTVGLKPIDKYNLMIKYVFLDLNLFYYGLIETSSLKKCKYYLKKVY